jgi:hypothetical protein
MKSKKLKIIGGIFLIFIMLFVGVFYYASTKLRPEEIKKMAIAQAKTVFPNADLSLATVDIGWGFNFNIHLEKLKLVATKDGKQTEMMAVDQLIVKVPIWALLSGRGIVEIKLDAPMMNYAEFTEGNNWTYALGNKKSEEVKASSGANPAAALGIFGKSKINVKLADISVKYLLRDNSNGEIKISRFLIKGLNFDSATAFELASTANFVMKDKSKISFDTLVIGQLNIADLVKNGSVSSMVIVKVNNMAKTGLAMKFPEVTTNVDVLLKKDGELSGKILTSFETQNKITANFKMTKEIEITDINVDIILKDVAAILGLENLADMSKSKLVSKGNIIYGADKKINANMTFAISPGIGYSKEGITATTSVEGSFKTKELAVKTKTDILEGEITSSVAGIFDPNEKFDMAKLKVFDIKVVAHGMKIPEKMIREKLWAKKAVEEKSDKADKATAEEATAESKSEAAAPPVGLPPSNVTLDWSAITIGNEDFSGHGRIITSLNSVAIDNMAFKFSKGTGKLSQTMVLGKNSSDSKFSFEITSLNLSSFKSFLPPFIENFAGVFTGKVTGSASIYKTQKMPAYDVTVVADAKNGELKKLNLSEYINPMLANIPIVKDQVKGKEVKWNGNFETFTMKGHFTNNQYSIPAFDFVGLDKKVQVTGNGEIYPNPGGKLSTVDVVMVDNTGKISDILLKNTGSKNLPMRLVGPGFDMKPDYAYTITKLSKGALRTKGEEKAKEVIMKNIDKLVPAAAKEKVQGLLNGFFKKK